MSRSAALGVAIAALTLAVGCSGGKKSSPPNLKGSGPPPTRGYKGGKQPLNHPVKHGARVKAGGSYPAALDLHGAATAVTQSPVTGATDDLTMEAWVWWNGPRKGGAQFILYNGNSGGNGYGVYFDDSNGYKLTVLLGGVGYMKSNYKMPEATWTHVAVVRSAGTWTLYINGSAQTLSPNNLNPYPPSGGTGIGSNSSRGQICDCTLDDVRIWNYARSAAQIRDVRGWQLRGDENALAAYWKLDEGYGDDGKPSRTAGDNSGHGFNASIQGDVVWWAADYRSTNPEEWLSDIKPIFNQYHCQPGYILNTQDLNEGAGGDDIYSCLAYGNRNGAILRLGVVISDNSDAQCHFNGLKRVEGDLNSRARGKFINFCISRGQGSIKTIGFDVWKTVPIFTDPCGWSPRYSRSGAHWNPGWAWIQGDLNKGVRFSKYIYTCVYLDSYWGCSVVSDEETGCGGPLNTGSKQRAKRRRAGS